MKKSIITIIMALVMSFTCLIGCGQTTTENETAKLASGGVLVVSVNPEIAIEYDENGLVTGVTARNDDALAIINSCEGLIGKEAREVVTKLVKAIGDAGYFVEEVEGEHRQITLEIEAGSRLPYDAFLDDVILDVRNCVDTNKWSVPMEVENESDYGMSDYVDTDYGTGNDGVTDYDDGKSNYDDGKSDYNNDSKYDDGESDYKASTTNKKPATTTPSKKPTTGNTDYDDGKSDYNNDSKYDDGESDYKASTTNKKPATTTPSKKPTTGNTDYDDGKSDYDNNSNYDSSSNYDDSSDYGNSDYDD